MLRAFVLFFALSVATAAAQTAPADGQMLQAILAEIHQLRVDLEATTVTAQRVQILLYRIQLQQSAVLRALTRADEVRGKLASAQEARTRNAKELEALQECVNSSTDSNRVKQCQLALTERKKSVEIWQNDEQQLQTRDVEAQSQLRAEQAKLDEFQDTLDRLDKALGAIAKK